MRPRLALASVLVLILGVLLAGNALERRFGSLVGRSLSTRLGVPLKVGGVGLRGLALEARDVRIGTGEGSAAINLDRVGVGWKHVEIEGGEIVLDEGLVFRDGSKPPGEKRAPPLPSFWSDSTHGTVRFERISLSLSSPRGKTEIGTFRGEIVREDYGAIGRLSAIMGGGSVSADGQFSATGEGSEGFRFQGAFGVRALDVEWEPLSRDPLTADARVELDGRWDGSRLSVSQGRLHSGKAEVEWGGSLDLSGERPLADFQMRLRETDCQNVIDAIPPGVMGEFSGFVIDGTLGGELHLNLGLENPERTRLEVSVRDRCRFRKAPRAAGLARLRQPFIHRVTDGDETLSFETGPSSPQWVDLRDVSPFFIHAALAQEDAQFFQHAGFLSDAFETALARNLEERRFASGASTISMQVARNLFLVRDKTLARKVQELVLTWWLEKSLSKREILELYVNLIEFGPRIYGIGPASWHYFGRAPSSLSPAEAAFLATVLPAPTRRHRDYERGELSKWSRARVEQLLRRMWERGRIDETALSHGLSEAAWLQFNRGLSRPSPRWREDFGWAAPLPYL